MASRRAVTTFAFSQEERGVARLSWEAPRDVPVDYRLRFKRADREWPSWKDRNEREARNIYLNNDFINIADVDEGVAYEATIRARYGPDGSGPWSQVLEFTPSFQREEEVAYDHYRNDLQPEEVAYVPVPEGEDGIMVDARYKVHGQDWDLPVTFPAIRVLLPRD